METREIITILRRAEHAYEGEGIPKEPFDFDNRLVLELDEDQNRLYNAIITTIPKETLSRLPDELDGCAWSLREKIEWMSKEHPKAEPKHYEAISKLLKLFLNKSSKKVEYARRDLTSRFDKQSYRDQNRILRAFLSGGAKDCDWAGRILRNNWRKEMVQEVKDAWMRQRRPMLAYVILRHFPNEYIISEQESLAGVVGYQYVCAVVGNEPDFIIDESRLTIPDRLYVMAKLGKEVDYEETERLVYNYLLWYDKYYNTYLYHTPSFSSIKGWNRMVWAMGILGMQDALVRLLEFENRVKASLSEDIPTHDLWPHFVARIKEAISPTNFSQRFEVEKGAYKEVTKMGIHEYTSLDAAASIIEPRMNIDNEIEQKEWYFHDEVSKHQFITIPEEWELFVESLYYDRPRLQSILKQAIINDRGYYQEIAIPVSNASQESWFQNGPLDEIKRSYEEYSRFASTDFDIVLRHSNDFKI